MNAYVMDMINGSEPTDASDWEDHLDESFTAEMALEEFAVFFNQQVQSGAPWTLEDFTPANAQASVSIINSEAGRFSMELSISPETELINGLVFNPLPEAEDAVDSFDELAGELDELPVDVTMMVVEDGQTIYERGAQQLMPLSSTSKLYVLYALAQAVEAGEADWEDTLTVTDELRSLPSGQLQDEEAGYEIGVADTALKMVSISDNTATDMIIDYLGREAVEEAVRATGHHDPSLLAPYLSSGDLFQLRWADPDLGEQYLNADGHGRGEILESLEEEALELDPVELTPNPDDEQPLEWYATAEDIVKLHQALSQAREDMPELTEILTTNPGLVIEPEDPWWDEVAYKGGSLLGSVSGSWTLSDPGGRERTVVVLVHGEHPAEVQSLLGPIFGLAQDAFTLDE